MQSNMFTICTHIYKVFNSAKYRGKTEYAVMILAVTTLGAGGLSKLLIDNLTDLSTMQWFAAIPGANLSACSFNANNLFMIVL